MSTLIQPVYASQGIGQKPFWNERPAQAEFPEKIDPVLDRAMALARVGAWSCNLADDRLSWTSGVYSLFGLPTTAALDRRQTLEMYTRESREALERHRSRAIAEGGTFTLDAEIVTAGAGMRWMRISGEMLRLANGNTVLHGLKQDVTEEKIRSVALRRIAENDAVTGLASRAVFESRFLNAQRTGASLVPVGALVLFDLDGFKGINDRFGHSAGDTCLRVFAERLSASFPQALLISRIGGDEFAVIIDDSVPADALRASVARFRARLRAPILWRQQMFTISATSGIAQPSDPTAYNFEELFIKADVALYLAKRAARGS